MEWLGTRNVNQIASNDKRFIFLIWKKLGSRNYTIWCSVKFDFYLYCMADTEILWNYGLTYLQKLEERQSISRFTSTAPQIRIQGARSFGIYGIGKIDSHGGMSRFVAFFLTLFIWYSIIYIWHFSEINTKRVFVKWMSWAHCAHHRGFEVGLGKVGLNLRAQFVWYYLQVRKMCKTDNSFNSF